MIGSSVIVVAIVPAVEEPKASAAVELSVTELCEPAAAVAALIVALTENK